MNEVKKYRKEQKKILLHELIETASLNKYLLEKMGFTVTRNQSASADYSGWHEMTYDEIYGWHTFDVSFGGRRLLYDISFSELERFYRIAKRYKHDFGLHRFNEKMDDMLADYHQIAHNVDQFFKSIR